MLRYLLFVFSLTFALHAHAEAGFVVKDSAGKQHRLSDYKGKWVLVNYWATWCPPCLEEVPDLVTLYDQHKHKDLIVIGIAFEYKSAKEVDKFADDMLMSYPIVLGDAKVAAQIGSAEVLPTTYLYDPQGKLVKVKRGIVTRQYIEQIISAK